MWNTATEAAIRGQVLAGVAAVSLAAPDGVIFQIPSKIVQWDRCLLEEKWGECAARGFNISEKELHTVWLGSETSGNAQFEVEHFTAWLKGNLSSSNQHPTPPAPAADSTASKRGVWC